MTQNIKMVRVKDFMIQTWTLLKCSGLIIVSMQSKGRLL